jgi:tetratricopeptide (TPR) repeat protein
MRKCAESNLTLYTIAVKELEQGKVHEAGEKFRRLTFLTPWNKYAYFQLGRCLLKTEKYADAVEEFGKAISISPTFVEAYFGLSLAHNFLKEFNKAIGVLEQAIKLNPNDSNLYYHLGITHEYGVRQGSGFTYFEKAVELHRGNCFARFELGNHYLRENKERDAIACFQNCLDTDAKFAPALIRLAQIFEKNGNWKKLSVVYDALIRAEPRNIDHYIGGIAILLKQDDLRSATEMLQKALRLEPKNAKLQAMSIYMNTRSKGGGNAVEVEIGAIEDIIQEHRNANERRIESLHAEIGRLKREKNKLDQRLTTKDTQLKDIEKKVKRIKSRFKKKTREIERIRGKDKKDDMVEELASKTIEMAHMTIEKRISATKKEIKRIENETLEIIGEEHWLMLTKDTKHFLTTAEYLYSLAKKEDIDFGLISVELAKAIEVELNDKLIQRFVTYLKGNGTLEAFIRENLRRTKNGKPVYHTKLGYVVDSEHYPEMKNLSLGQINLLLRGSIEGCVGTGLFKEFIQKQCKNPPYFLDPNRFPRLLESIIIRYRNPFAHSACLKVHDFETFRSELFYGFDGGIFVQLLDACGAINP